MKEMTSRSGKISAKRFKQKATCEETVENHGASKRVKIYDYPQYSPSISYLKLSSSYL